MYLSQFDGAQNFSSICMCVEFPFQALKQKNAHVPSEHAFGKLNSQTLHELIPRGNFSCNVNLQKSFLQDLKLQDAIFPCGKVTLYRSSNNS